jgi:hypothetical protein
VCERGGQSNASAAGNADHADDRTIVITICLEEEEHDYFALGSDGDIEEDQASCQATSFPGRKDELQIYGNNDISVLSARYPPSFLTRILLAEIGQAPAAETDIVTVFFQRIVNNSEGGCREFADTTICPSSLQLIYRLPLRTLLTYDWALSNESKLFHSFHFGLIDFMLMVDVAKMTRVSKCFYSTIVSHCRRNFVCERGGQSNASAAGNLD